MKKILSILALMLTTCIGAWAQTMPFEAATSADDPEAQMYYIYEPDHQLYVKVSSDNLLGNGFSGDQFIFVQSSDPALYYIYNKSCGKYITYTRTTDPGTSVTSSAQSAVQLTSDFASAKTWRFVKEGQSDTYDIFPGEATSYAANSGAASWNFRGGKTSALNLYAASDRSSSWQIVAQLSAKLNCATRLFAEPGAKFMHKLVGNNKDDVQTVTGLPDGFTINEDRPDYKYITGTAPAAGEYEYTLNLKDGTTETVRLTVSDQLTQPRPLMGVLTWNAFQNHIDENVIIKLAEGFEKFALKDAGYEYMCIDDQWAQRNRDASGHLQWRTEKFPNYTTLADRIHEMGLKIGIYSDAGSATCSGAQPGSYGKETVDAQDFVNWGFDLLKYDFCNATGGTSAAAAENAYKAMGDALKDAAAAKGKDFLFYMCEWGYRSPWLWGANTGATCWRATDDTRDYWSHPNGGVLQVLNKMKTIWAYQGVNRWNDADMMCIGLHGSGYSSNNNSALGYGDGDSRCTGLTMAEQRSQMALWCMFASPLTHSNNITNLDGKPNSLTGKTVTNSHFREDLDIILNKELIALDQDPLGQAGEPIYDETDYIVFQKDMEDGSIGLSITNLSGSQKSITVDFGRLSALKSGVTYKMRDLWKHEYVGREYTNDYKLTVSVPSHDTFVYRIQNVADEDLTWAEPVIPGLEGIENPEPEPEATVYQAQAPIAAAADLTDGTYFVSVFSKNKEGLLIGNEYKNVSTEVVSDNYETDNADLVWTIAKNAEGQFTLTNAKGQTISVQGQTAVGKHNVLYTSEGDYAEALFTLDESSVSISDVPHFMVHQQENMAGGTSVAYLHCNCDNPGLTGSNLRLSYWQGSNADLGQSCDKIAFYPAKVKEGGAPEPEPEPEDFPVVTSTLAAPYHYHIRNLGADDGSYKGNDCYLGYNASYPASLYHVVEADADKFIFIADGQTVKIYDTTISKYVTYTSTAQGSINWAGNGSLTGCSVALTESADEAKGWYIVADENTADRYDVLPTATAANGWSFMGGIDRDWVLLNLEDKTNRNCKWVFESVAGPTSLDTLESITRESHTTYDLFGRRVNTPKQGGIYIVGGKRLMK